MRRYRNHKASHQQMRALAEKLGPSGEFPQGKLNDHDEGELRLAVAHDQGKVLIDFGKPTVWIGFDPQQAADFAATILKHAREAGAARGIVIEFKL